MAPQTVKEQVLRAVEDPPQDTTFEQAMERIYFLARVERGLAQADAGELIDHAEIRREFGAADGAVDVQSGAPLNRASPAGAVPVER